MYLFSSANFSWMVYPVTASKEPRWVLHSVAPHCCDPCRTTQCRAHSVAANSRNFRDVAGVSRYIPHPAPKYLKKNLSHLSCHPSVTVSQEEFLAKTDRSKRGCSSCTHTNRATLWPKTEPQDWKPDHINWNYPGTESRIGTAGTVSQEPKQAEPHMSSDSRVWGGWICRGVDLQT